MKKEDIAKQIIEAVGTKANINNAWHCMTRLRFDVKDEKKVKYQELELIEGVVGVKTQSGQLQVVIGTNVDAYFIPLAKLLDLDQEKNSQSKVKKGLVSLFMDTVSGVFGPIVPAIAGAGMIKGLMAGLAALNIISNTTHTYLVIDMIASGVFTFLPFFVAASAAKIFKTNQYLAIAIAAMLQFPTMSAAVASKEIANFMLFDFIPVPVFNYAGTVIPIIFAVLALSYIFRFIDKILPEVLRTVFTPTISLFIVGIITFTFIGPIGIHLGNLLAEGIAWLFTISPLLAGIIVGAIRPIAIFTGLHHAMTPIALQNFANQGWDMLMPMMFMANMAITGATAAIYFKVKNSKEKSIVVSSAVSGLLGITEPALFGVLSKYKKAFFAATIGSSIASALISFFGVRIYGYILSSIFSLPAYIGEYFVYAIVGIITALVVSFAIAYAMVKKEDDEHEDVILSAVSNGVYVPLQEVNDEMFSTKMIGDGYAMTSSDGEIYAPVSGIVKSVFPTKHAIGIKTKEGIDVLIHMGIDTVQLQGKGFDVVVKEGDCVVMKQKIAHMDMAFLQAQQKDTTIMVVVSNMDKVATVQQQGKVNQSLQPGVALSTFALHS